MSRNSILVLYFFIGKFLKVFYLKHLFSTVFYLGREITFLGIVLNIFEKFSYTCVR